MPIPDLFKRKEKTINGRLDALEKYREDDKEFYKKLHSELKELTKVIEKITKIVENKKNE